MRWPRRSPDCSPERPDGVLASRRALLRRATAAAALGLLPASWGRALASASPARVLVIGGGFAGATCARYLKRLAPGLAVTLVEPVRRYLTCPGSNAVLAGLGTLAALELGYDRLAGTHGVELVHDEVLDVDFTRRRARLAGGAELAWDRLVVAPGIRLSWGSPEGYDQAAAERMPHAWRPGAQTLLLQRQLQSMDDGGTVAISVPPAPFRCPPAPYERASLLAGWLARHKPRARVLVLDANDRFTKQALFMQAWAALYPGRIEWRPLGEDGRVLAVEPRTLTLHTEFERHRVAVANVIPAQGAGELAHRLGLTDETGWCPVEPSAFESTRVPGVHVIGDAAQASPMPKSASAANSQAKAVALQIVAALAGEPPIEPSFHNTCYSLAAEDWGITVSGIYAVRAGRLEAVEGAGGTSPLDAPAEVRRQEARYTAAWHAAITADSFG